jgi:hypothetical protein
MAFIDFCSELKGKPLKTRPGIERFSLDFEKQFPVVSMFSNTSPKDA